MKHSGRYYGLTVNRPSCYYCNEEARMHFRDNEMNSSRYLCTEHGRMHFEGDPWLELVELVMEADAT